MRSGDTDRRTTTYPRLRAELSSGDHDIRPIIVGRNPFDAMESARVRAIDRSFGTGEQ
jgi:hypothetical protein